MKGIALLFLFIITVQCSVAQPAGLDKIMSAYWDAATPREKEKAIKSILNSKVSFRGIYSLIEQGRPYSSAVKRGFFSIPQQGELLPPNCLVFVPYDYSPGKKYPLRVLLHGAVSNTNPDFVYQFVDTLNAAYKTSQVIQVYPSGWSLAPWWSDAQVQNVNFLLRWMKDHYNVDENNVRLSGISDGGIGSFFIANSDATPWSCITPFIGSLAALQQLNVRPTYINNLSNKPFYIVNAGKDEIFRKEAQLPYMDLFMKANHQSTFVMVDSSRHSMRWYPLLRDSINQFGDRNMRKAYPDSLVWQSELTEKYNRIHYLVIHKIVHRTSVAFDDHNILRRNGQLVQAFQRNPLTGFVQLYKSGNTVHVRTSNIKEYTLLLSPDHFDFTKAITIITNGKQRFETMVEPKVATLLKWNSVDHDRTILFGAEITIEVN